MILIRISLLSGSTKQHVVFSDRLVDKQDEDMFTEIINKGLTNRFKVIRDELKKTNNLLYCDFYEEANDQKPYVQVTDGKKSSKQS